jgi:hypothetical protein
MKFFIFNFLFIFSFVCDASWSFNESTSEKEKREISGASFVFDGAIYVLAEPSGEKRAALLKYKNNKFVESIELKTLNNILFLGTKIVGIDKKFYVSAVDSLGKQYLAEINAPSMSVKLIELEDIGLAKTISYIDGLVVLGTNKLGYPVITKILKSGKQSKFPVPGGKGTVTHALELANKRTIFFVNREKEKVSELWSSDTSFVILTKNRMVSPAADVIKFNKCVVIASFVKGQASAECLDQNSFEATWKLDLFKQELAGATPVLKIERENLLYFGGNKNRFLAYKISADGKIKQSFFDEKTSWMTPVRNYAVEGVNGSYSVFGSSLGSNNEFSVFRFFQTE